MPIQVLALKTSWERWTIETSGDKGSGRSMLAAWHDDEDDDIYICMFIVYLYLLNKYLWTYLIHYSKIYIHCVYQLILVAQYIPTVDFSPLWTTDGWSNQKVLQLLKYTELYLWSNTSVGRTENALTVTPTKEIRPTPKVFGVWH